MKYLKIDNVENIELAGLLHVANSSGNYRTIVYRLKLLLALRYNMQKGEDILKQIEAEAEECFLPYHEYVINELQPEYRYSSKLKSNEKYENEVLSKWARSIALRYNLTLADEFLDLIKINRDSRTH